MNIAFVFCVFLVTSNPGLAVPCFPCSHEVDFLEINHVICANYQYNPLTRSYEIEYTERLVQWIGWTTDQYGILHADWWRHYKGMSLIAYRDKKFLLYIDGHYVWTPRIEETYTDYDVEVADRDRYPLDYRIGLEYPEQLLLSIQTGP